MNDYLRKLNEIEELQFTRRVINEDTVMGIRNEINNFVERTGKDDIESIMIFVINFVGQDSYNQGVVDALKILRSTTNAN